MTSAPSRRQPSSGNKVWLVLIALCCITACGAGKHIEAAKPPTGEVVPINLPDSTVKIPAPIDIDNNGKSIPEQAAEPAPTPVTAPIITPSGGPVNIAVILPFNLDQIPLEGYVDDTTKSISGDPKNAIEFYLGCKLAKESFSNTSLTANVYFLDDRNDSAEIFEVLKHKPFPNVRYIVGPIYPENLIPVAAYSKSRQISVISPVSASMYVAKDNPFYYSATPTIKTQYEFLLGALRDANPGKTVEVIYDETDSLQEGLDFIKQIIQQQGAYPNPALNAKFINILPGADAAKLLAQADTLSTRAVLIYSNKETYIKTVLAKLKPLKNKLNIYTLPAIRSTKLLVDTKYPHSIFLASPFYADEPATKAYAEKYEEVYNKKPTDYFFQGYDLMHLLLDQLAKGVPIQEPGDPLYYDQVLNTRFRFTPVLNAAQGIEYYENKHLYLLKWQSGIFVKVK